MGVYYGNHDEVVYLCACHRDLRTFNENTTHANGVRADIKRLLLT